MKNLFLIIAFFIAGSASFGQEKETPPVGGEPKGFELPAKEVVSFDNGLELVMVPWGSLPKVDIAISVKTGNIHEQEDEVWLSDILADLMKEGTNTMNGNEIADAFAGMGGNLNIGVSPLTTNVNASILSDFASDAITIMSDLVINPAFPEGELERLINDNKRQLSVALTRAQSIATADFYAALYPDHPYGRIFPTPEMLDSYTIEKVNNFYDSNFGAQRTTVYVAGVFDKQEVIKAVTAQLGNWKTGPESFYPVAEPVIGQTVQIEDRPDAPQTTLRFGLPVVSQSDKDYVPLFLANQILGGSFSSRITSNIREDKGYTYSPRSSVDNLYGGGVWFQSADVTTEDSGAALTEILKEIKLMQSEEVTDRELDGIKNYQAGLFVLQNATRGGIIGQLNNLNVHDLPDEFLTEFVANIYNVSKEDIQSMVAKYIRPEDMTLITVGDKKVIKEQIEEFQEKIVKEDDKEN